MKIKIIHIVFILLTVVFATSAFSLDNTKQKKIKTEDNSAISFYTDPNKVIVVTKQHPNIELKIKSNPTTGFAWFLVDYNRHLIRPMARKYIAPKTKEMGAPGYVLWEFSVLPSAFTVPQLTHITLQYLQPWVVSTSGQKLDYFVVIDSSKM